MYGSASSSPLMPSTAIVTEWLSLRRPRRSSSAHFGIVFDDEYPHLQYYQLVTAGLGLDEDFAYRRPGATQLTLRIDPYNEDSYERSLDHSSKRRVCREKHREGKP